LGWRPRGAQPGEAVFLVFGIVARRGAAAGFRASFAVSGLFESLDARLRQWPVASLSLLAIALVLAAMAAYGG